MKIFKLNWKNKFSHKTIPFILMLLLIISCATPVKYEPHKKSGIWSVKAQVLDKKTNKDYVVSMDVISVWPSHLRLDISGPMGISLASLVQKNEEAQIALYRQKKYYSGKVSSDTMLSVLKIRFSPKILIPIAFDSKISEKNWACQQDDIGRPKMCINEVEKLKIIWTEREEEKKRVQIYGPDFELNLKFKDFKPGPQTLVQEMDSNKGPFTLNVPNGFSEYKF